MRGDSWEKWPPKTNDFNTYWSIEGQNGPKNQYDLVGKWAIFKSFYPLSGGLDTGLKGP